MKIRNLRLIGLGPFEDKNLDFDRSGIQIIYGKNEAGKSTTLKGIRAGLFGFDQFTSYGPDSAKIRVGMVVKDSLSGKEINFFRRKGRKGTIMASSVGTETLPDSSLETILSGLTKETFETQFAITYNEVLAGAEALKISEGDLGEALFSAGTGIVDIKRILTSIDDELSSLLSPKSGEIRRSLKDFEDKRKLVRRLSVQSSEWIESKKLLEDLDKQRIELRDTRKKILEDISRLQRIIDVMPLVAARTQILNKITLLGEVIEVSEDAVKQCRLENISRDQATSRIASLTSELETLKNKIEAFLIEEVVIANEPTIEMLYQDARNYKEKLARKLILKTSIELSEKSVRNVLEKILPAETYSEGFTVRLPSDLTSKLNSLISQYGKIKADYFNAKNDTNSAQSKLNDLEYDLKILPILPDISKLSTLILDYQTVRGFEREIYDTRTKISELDIKFASTVAQLPMWKVSTDELLSFEIISNSEIDNYDEESAEIDNNIKRVTVELDEIRKDINTTNDSINTIDSSNSIPTEDALAKARHTRDKGWNFILKSWKKQEIDETEESFTNGQKLEELYPKLVKSADDIADHITKESNRVASLRELRNKLEGLLKIENEYINKKAIFSIQKQEIETKWQTIWGKIGVTPSKASDMRKWKQSVENLREISSEINMLKNRLKLSINEEDGIKVRFSNALEQLNKNYLNEIEGFTVNQIALFTERLVKDIEKRNSDLITLKAQVHKVAKELENKRNSELGKLELWNSWQDNWNAAISDSGLPRDLTPETAAEYIQQRADLQSEIDALEKSRSAMTIEAQDILTYERQVAEVCRYSNFTMDGESVYKSIINLHEDLKEMRKRNEEKNRLTEDFLSKQKDLEKNNRIFKDAESAVSTLLKISNVNSVEELEHAERIYNTKLQLERELKTVEEPLIRMSAGLSINEIEIQIEGVNPDQIKADLDSEQIKLNHIQDDLSRIDKEFIEGELKLKHFSGESKAAEAQEESQQILAKIRFLSERYRVLKISKKIINDAIEKYRSGNETPIINRANELFIQLTAGSFKKIFVDFDEKDDPIIKGERANGASITMDEMSDGTRDQLYLALRIASVENNASQSQHYPFIVDDILVNFDDERAKNTLIALSQLSKITQVLFFTHHSRLVELAESHLSCDDYVIHNLSD